MAIGYYSYLTQEVYASCVYNTVVSGPYKVYTLRGVGWGGAGGAGAPPPNIFLEGGSAPLIFWPKCISCPYELFDRLFTEHYILLVHYFKAHEKNC